MFAPQYSLRKFIGFVTASAFACVVVAAALRGQLWGVAVMIALASLGVLLSVHGVLFLSVAALGRLAAARQRFNERRSAQRELSP